MSKATERDPFPPAVRDVLAKRVSVRCSNPSCRKVTIGPRNDAQRIVCIGVGAHITAASRGGPRYDESLTPEQRAAVENGIWLCQNCGKLVDNDVTRYTVEILRGWKQRAESEALKEIEGGGTGPEDAAELELTDRVVDRRDNTSGEGVRHDYILTVTVRNLGNERLAGYHVELEMPARVLEQPEKNAAYVPGRSSRKRAFFRSAATDDLFPGDTHDVIVLPYYVDNEIYDDRRAPPEKHVFTEPVRAALYRRQLPPVTVEKPFEAIQKF